MSGMSSMDWVTFFSRNGYGGYIWGSIGMCALVIWGECWALRRKRLQLRRQIGQEAAQEPAPSRSPMPSKDSVRDTPKPGAQS